MERDHQSRDNESQANAETETPTIRCCGHPDCDKHANLRCSRCKLVYYCSAEHQKSHWTIHKSLCRPHSQNNSGASKVPSALIENPAKAIASLSAPSSSSSGEKRVSRCMFCGEELNLSSEDEAVKHMEVCDALQEQLNSKDQFTIPSRLRSKIPEYKPG
jgi:MYND finger